MFSPKFIKPKLWVHFILRPDILPSTYILSSIFHTQTYVRYACCTQASFVFLTWKYGKNEQFFTTPLAWSIVRPLCSTHRLALLVTRILEGSNGGASLCEGFKGTLREDSFTGGTRKMRFFWERCKMPCKRASLSIEALLGNLEGVRLLGLLREKCIWVPF
jgi:hypothetical protein